MPYLTYEEYNNFGFTEITEEEFNKLIKKASEVVDDVTGFFYKFNDIETDHPFRRDQFKKAIAAQVEYFNDMGATTLQGLTEYGSVTIGRTTVSKGGRNSNQSQESTKLVANDTLMYLRPTGLLYRGMAVRS